MIFAHVRIVLHDEAGAWRCETTILGDPAAARTIDALVDDGARYPAAAGSPLTAAAIGATVTSLVDGQPAPDPDAVAKLGAHLFAALLAPVWPAIEARLAAAPPHLLEIALDLDDAPALRALPWELMAGPAGWLARAVPIGPDRQVLVAITRRTRQGIAQAPPLVHPLRYLFVIGTSIGDDIRAGAECLGLLRQVGGEIHDRVVERLSLAELSSVVAEFEPHVVHVICHGRAHPRDGVLLSMHDARGENKVSGAQLAKALVRTDATGRHAPAIVVLSTCSSGDTMLPDAGTSLAGALVGEGVPMVIGMGAAIHDQACRLFSIELGQALVKRTPLLAAAGYGRSAALLGSKAPARRFDWGLIQVVLGRDQPGDVAVQSATGTSHEDKIIRWLEASNLEINLPRSEPTYPPLCGVDDAVRRFYKLLAGQKAGLVILAEPPSDGVKVGRRRLMSELAAVAIRAGHAPVLVMDRPDVPRDPVELAQHLARAFRDAWRRHQLDRPPPEQPDAPVTPPPGRVASLAAVPAGLTPEQQAQQVWIDVDAFADALAADCDALRAMMRTRHGGGEPILFFHDLHAYGDAVRLVLRFLTARGKADLLAIAPVVVSWKQGPAVERGRGELPKATERAELLKTTLVKGAPYLEQVVLKPLVPRGSPTVPLAARLALQRVLLHPHRSEPPEATRRWLLDISGQNVASKAALNLLSLAAKQCSLGQFDSPDFWDQLTIAVMQDAEMPSRALDEADDDDVLARGGRR